MVPIDGSARAVARNSIFVLFMTTRSSLSAFCYKRPAVAMVLLCCFYGLLWCCYIVVTVSSWCCNGVVMVLLWCYGFVMVLSWCCNGVVIVLL